MGITLWGGNHIPKEKWNYNSIKEYVEEHRFHLVNGKSIVNSKSPITLKSTEGYLVVTTFFKFKLSHNPEFFNKNNPYTCHNIELWCKLNNKPFELISTEFPGTHEKLICKCTVGSCKEEFDITWGNIQSNRGCPYCSGKKVSISNCFATYHPELIDEWHPTKNGDLTPYNVTFGSGKLVWWKCKVNPEHEWRVSVNNRHNGNGCPCCSSHLIAVDNNLFTVNPTLCLEWDYSKNEKHPSEFTPNSLSKAWWICSDCKHDWETRISHRNNGSDCPKCNKSKGEKKIEEWLILNSRNHIPQYTFPDLLSDLNNHLRFDFADFNEDNILTLIEYDGEFHYKKVHDQHDLEKQQYHDKLKNDYSKLHNIKLIRIPYWEFDNIEVILDKQLNNKIVV